MSSSIQSLHGGPERRSWQKSSDTFVRVSVIPFERLMIFGSTVPKNELCVLQSICWSARKMLLLQSNPAFGTGMNYRSSWISLRASCRRQLKFGRRSTGLCTVPMKGETPCGLTPFLFMCLIQNLMICRRETVWQYRFGMKRKIVGHYGSSATGSSGSLRA